MKFGIIAAGEGSRLAQEGVIIPKPLVEIGGEPMIGRLLKIFAKNNAEEINLVINKEMPAVVEFVCSIKDDLGCPVKIQELSTPSSMHTFYELTRDFKEDDRFIVTTVDTIFREEDFRSYVDYFENAAATIDGAMAVTSYIEDEKPLYVKTDEDGLIIGFLDNPVPGIKFVSGGIYGLKGNALPILQDCLESGVSRMRNYQRALVAAGLSLKACDLGKILDIDHAGDIVSANNFINGK